ncbi:MAG: MATE family efflux transporter [Parasporobacterium sp.]|nr:MATE family efflux transporter [Parasporobacterium sp.]
MKLTLENVLKNTDNSRADQIRMVLNMSVPAILAELTSIAMQYIDAGMVGSLGANATGAIGLVTSSTWLVGGVCIGLSTGFSVQVAQLIGAGKNKAASDVLRQALTVLLCMGLLICALGISISRSLPYWLGGGVDIAGDAGTYFLIFSASIPFSLMRQLSGAMMQCSGDMKTPSILSAAVCLLDVIFNMVLIFPTREVQIFGKAMTIPGAGLGVTGAALGTAAAEVVISLIMLYAVCIRNKKINIRGKGSWKWQKNIIKTAVKIAVPLSLDQIFMCSAYVVGTIIVAPLGTAAVAANSLAVTAESLCYMPGYGIGHAATAIIGQTIGAGRKDLTRSFSRVSVYLGIIMMALMGVLMYFLAPAVFSLLTNDPKVAQLGTEVLRTELFAEPLYGASICCAGVFRGAGDTLVPSIMNLASMWCVRIVLAWIIVPVMGLKGYWLAMCIELCVRGIIFLIRMYSGRWQKKSLI